MLTAYEESRALGSSYIGPEHVLLALARDEESEAGRLLSRFGLSHTKLRGAVVRGVEKDGEAREPASATPTLDEFSRDLTRMAKEGKLDPVIGREDAIETTIEILSRRTKNNPVLIGDPGVGKTAIVEGIAQRIVNDEVPVVPLYVALSSQWRSSTGLFSPARAGGRRGVCTPLSIPQLHSSAHCSSAKCPPKHLHLAFWPTRRRLQGEEFVRQANSMSRTLS